MAEIKVFCLRCDQYVDYSTVSSPERDILIIMPESCDCKKPESTWAYCTECDLPLEPTGCNIADNRTWYRRCACQAPDPPIGKYPVLVQNTEVGKIYTQGENRPCNFLKVERNRGFQECYDYFVSLTKEDAGKLYGLRQNTLVYSPSPPELQLTLADYKLWDWVEVTTHDKPLRITEVNPMNGVRRISDGRFTFTKTPTTPCRLLTAAEIKEIEK